jgi:hypothetical protein
LSSSTSEPGMIMKMAQAGGMRTESLLGRMWGWGWGQRFGGGECPGGGARNHDPAWSRCPRLVAFGYSACTLQCCMGRFSES